MQANNTKIINLTAYVMTEKRSNNKHGIAIDWSIVHLKNSAKTSDQK